MSVENRSQRPAAPHVPRLGHVGRMRLPSKVRWLISGHLVVFALSLEDEEIVEVMAETWNLGARAQITAEVLLSLVLLAAWGCLTVTWARLTCEPRGEKAAD